MASVQAPVIPILERWIAETPGTISLGQGLVSFGPPAVALDAARRFGALPADHRYGPNEGIPTLIAALEDKLARENGIIVRPASRLFVTAGGNLAFMTAAFAVLDAGDEVILPAPFYFNHEMAIVMAGGVPVSVPTAENYQLDVDAIAAAVTPRTRLVVTVSPNNPTGAVYSEATLRRLNQLCRDRGLFHIHDEAYEYFVYGGASHFSPASIAGAADHTISLFTLSKAYGMASWRVGYMVFPARLEDAVNKVQDTLIICAPVVSQHAAVAAIGVGRSYTEAQLTGLDAARQFAINVLSAADVPCDVADSQGAFYHFLRIHSALDPMTLSERLIREHRVAILPGSAFGLLGSCSARVSYGALDRSTLEEGLKRLARGLQVIG